MSGKIWLAFSQGFATVYLCYPNVLRLDQEASFTSGPFNDAETSNGIELRFSSTDRRIISAQESAITTPSAGYTGSSAKHIFHCTQEKICDIPSGAAMTRWVPPTWCPPFPSITHYQPYQHHIEYKSSGHSPRRIAYRACRNGKYYGVNSDQDHLTRKVSTCSTP